ncbi:MAG: hypothetical protein KC464_10360 [Myxococcales bacterium]|nr:hypothetical protein [Myxococcales bacterium]
MDENYEITFVDDERNARPERDHRERQVVRTPFGAKRPRRITIQGGGGGSREPVVVRQVAADPVEYPERRLFGNLTGSEAVEVGSQILASLQPLPVAPVATGRLEVDVENLTLYHAAVALHFKRDEQLRTIGSLLAKLMS